jgi:hypothetical protein
MVHQARTNGGVGSMSPRPGTDGNGDLEFTAAARLRELGRCVAPVEISEIWVFPPLPHLEDSSEFLLFTRILPDQMRHLCGAEFDAGNGHGGGSGERLPDVNGKGNGNGASSGAVRRITEYGAMPLHRVQRVVARFRERLGDHREPLHLEIGGDVDSWDRILEPAPE